MRMLKKDLIERIEKDYEERLGLFGSARETVCANVEKQTGLTKTLCQFMYAYQPLSDIGDYGFEVFLGYAEHAAFLYENSEYVKAIPDEYFLNYVASPRINSEDLTDCRRFFYDLVHERVEGMPVKEAVLELNNWCYENGTYHSTSERTASPITFYKGGYGRCGEESTFLTTILRSVGIPARQVYAPRWSHSPDNHAWTEIYVDGAWLYTGACEPKPVFNCGWFPYAASRAMILHSRSFSPFTFEKEDSVLTKDGIVTMMDNGKLYAHQKEVKVCAFHKDGSAAANVCVRMEIVNSAEFYPVVTICTDANGEGSVKLGLGTIHVYAISGKEKFETYCYVPDTDVIEVRLGDELVDGEWHDYYMEAPESATISHVELSEEEDKAQCEKNAIADGIRNSRIASYYDAEFAEQYKDYKQIYRALNTSRGNFDEVKKFLQMEFAGCTLKEKDRMLACMTQKDCRDLKADILADHMQAFVKEAEVMSRLQNIPETTIFVDAESKAPSEDIFAEFYQAKKDFYTEYVVSPRVQSEKLSAYRSEIKAILGEENPFANPGEIWNYIKENCKYYENQEYTTIMATPGTVLKLKAGTVQAQYILFVAICRTYGIPARIDMTYKRPQFFDGSQFVYVEFGNVEMGTAVIDFVDEKLPGYYSTFTLGYQTEDGSFSTVNHEDFFVRMQKHMEVKLLPGVYRFVTCVRTKTGSVVGKTMKFTVKAAEKTCISLTCKEKHLDSLITRREVPYVTLYDASGECVSTQRYEGEGVHIFLFLKPGNEPTEHIFTELTALHNAGKKLECPIHFVLKSKDEMDNASFQKVSGFVEHDLWFDPQEEAMAALSQATRTKMESYPYVCVMDGAGMALFADCGYRVGMIETLERILEEK